MCLKGFVEQPIEMKSVNEQVYRQVLVQVWRQVDRQVCDQVWVQVKHEIR